MEDRIDAFNALAEDLDEGAVAAELKLMLQTAVVDLNVDEKTARRKVDGLIPDPR